METAKKVCKSKIKSKKIIKKKKVKIEKPKPILNTCRGTTRDGKPCTNKCKKEFCHFHRDDYIYILVYEFYQNGKTNTNVLGIGNKEDLYSNLINSEIDFSDFEMNPGEIMERIKKGSVVENNVKEKTCSTTRSKSAIYKKILLLKWTKKVKVISKYYKMRFTELHGDYMLLYNGCIFATNEPETVLDKKKLEKKKSKVVLCNMVTKSWE